MAVYYLLSGGDRLKGMFGSDAEEQLNIDLKEKTNLVSVGAKREYEKNDIYFYGDETILGAINSFKFSDLKEFNLIDGRTSKEEGLEFLKKADIIYLQGGDPFVQLKYLRDNGYDEFLKTYDGIILGLSAGSMNMGRTAFYSKDEDYPETILYEGLGLVDITIDPHFEIDNANRVNEAKEYSNQLPIIGLPDNSIIRVVGNNITSIGIHYLFEKGTMTKINEQQEQKKL